MQSRQKPGLQFQYLWWLSVEKTSLGRCYLDVYKEQVFFFQYQMRKRCGTNNYKVNIRVWQACIELMTPVLPHRQRASGSWACEFDDFEMQARSNIILWAHHRYLRSRAMTINLFVPGRGSSSLMAQLELSQSVVKLEQTTVQPDGQRC